MQSPGTRSPQSIQISMRWLTTDSTRRSVPAPALLAQGARCPCPRVNRHVIRTLRLGPRAKTRIGRRNWNNS